MNGSKDDSSLKPQDGQHLPDSAHTLERIESMFAVHATNADMQQIKAALIQLAEEGLLHV